MNISAQARADLDAIGQSIYERVKKVGVGRMSILLACLAALRHALDQLSPDERACAVVEIMDALKLRVVRLEIEKGKVE